MIKVRARPGSRVVALSASLREAGLHVVGLRRSLEILEVTADASRVGAGQGVIAIHVALGALDAGVRAGQWEARSGVIEGCRRPGGRGVALLTSLRERRLHVIRLGGALEILQVATDTSGIGAGQVVVAVHVALRALHA